MDPDELEKQVRALIDQDQKIEAIKLVRLTTGWGLRESKDYVDALARAALPALSSADEAALEREVNALVEQDRYVEAIKRVRERTGWGLGDCKTHVDMLTRGSTTNWTFVASRASDLLDQGMKDRAAEWVAAHAKLNAQEAQDYVDFVLTAKSTHSSLGNLKVPAPVVMQVRDLLVQERKVEAVKLVRILTNWSLRESKDYVDSLELKKRRRKRCRRRAKARPTDGGFKISDSVVVRSGAIDPDFDIEIGGWQGRISEIHPAGNQDTVMIAWDSVTLRHVPGWVIAQSAERGLDWTLMGIEIRDVELADPRDTERDVAQAVEALSREHAWSWLGEEGIHIGEILAGVDPDDEMALLDRWEEHLQRHLRFPFDAEVAEYQERGPLQSGDRVSVHSVFDVDDHYGIIVLIKHGRQQYHFPLCDLEAADERSANYQLVHDYAVWFANR